MNFFEQYSYLKVFHIYSLITKLHDLLCGIPIYDITVKVNYEYLIFLKSLFLSIDIVCTVLDLIQHVFIKLRDPTQYYPDYITLHINSTFKYRMNK